MYTRPLFPHRGWGLGTRLGGKWPGTYCTRMRQYFHDIYRKILRITPSKHVVMPRKRNVDETESQCSNVGFSPPWRPRLASSPAGPRRPYLFNVAREKRGSLVKLITCMTSGGTNFHIIMVQQQVGWLKRCISHRKFEFFVTIGYESVSGGPPVPSLRVENGDLHGNFIVSTPRWNRLGSVQITVFDTQRRD